MENLVHFEAESKRLIDYETGFQAGPAIANGAALVGLLGLLGNVPKPDLAWDALEVPIAFFALGLAAGLQAMVFTYALRAEMLAYAAGLDEVELAKYLLDQTVDVFAPIDFEMATHVFGSREAAIEKAKEVMLGRLTSQKDLTAKAATIRDEGFKKLDRSREAMDTARGKMNLWRLASIAMAVAAVTFMLGAHHQRLIALDEGAVWLQPTPAAAPATPPARVELSRTPALPPTTPPPPGPNSGPRDEVSPPSAGRAVDRAPPPSANSSPNSAAAATAGGTR
jgi:hypothetical protein